jgi:hypothetical protein
MCFVFYSIFSSNSLKWTEIQRAVRFDAVPILSKKNPTYKYNEGLLINVVETTIRVEGHYYSHLYIFTNLNWKPVSYDTNLLLSFINGHLTLWHLQSSPL